MWQNGRKLGRRTTSKTPKKSEIWEGKNRGTKEEAEEEDDQDLVEADGDEDSEADWSTDDDSQD